MDVETFIGRETLVSMVINAFLSIMFFLIFFGGQSSISLWGMGQWVFDFIPQSFMITAMSTLVPGYLTSKKIRAGTMVQIDYHTKLPRNLIARALIVAVVSAVIGTGLVAIIVATTGLVVLPYTAALLLKPVYGVILAVVVTPMGLRAALAKPSER